MLDACHINFVIDLAHRGVSVGQWLEHRSAECEDLRFDSSWGLRIFSLSHARDKTKTSFSVYQVFTHSTSESEGLRSLRGSVVRASECGMRRSEVRFLMGTQNFFFVPRSWQEENIFLCLSAPLFLSKILLGGVSGRFIPSRSRRFVRNEWRLFTRSRVRHFE